MIRIPSLSQSSVLVGAIVAGALGLHGLQHPGLVQVPGGALPATGQAASAKSGSKSTSGSGGATSSQGAQGGAAHTATQSRMTPTQTKLAQSPYSAYAVPVYPKRSTAAAQALDGFSLGVVPGPAGGRTVEISIPSQGVVYRQAIAATDLVYFVEGSMSDDATGLDVNAGDDGVIITNAQGYILK